MMQKIAVVLNVHGDEELVLDTLDSIRTFVTDDILVVVDGAKWDWGKNVDFGCPKIQGFYHNYHRNPYKNIALGLKHLYEMYDADWYCYVEYDVLFTSSDFKKDLELASQRNVWMMGNDLKTKYLKFPLIEKLFDLDIKSSRCFLGCCVFYSKEFMDKLKEIDFFNVLLKYTNGFSSGYFPGFESQRIYVHDLSEDLYPTLANYFGGRLEQFARWEILPQKWSGNHRRYPMRWRPDIENAHLMKSPSIIHPLKGMDGSRKIFKERRKCLKK